MLPKNYKVTELVKAINKDQDHFKLYSDYYATLSAHQKIHLDRIMLIHNSARESYLAHHNMDNLGTAPQQTQVPIHHHQAPTQKSNIQQPHVTNIYVYNNRRSSLWYDWWIWNTMYSRPYYQYPHNNTHTHTHQSKDKRKDEPNAAQIILGIMLALGAAAATLFSFVEMGRCVNQLCYAEHVFGNLSRIALGLIGVLAGAIGGYALGVSLLAMPVLGMIVGSLITAGLMIWASKYLIEAVQKAIPSESALDYDPRFCLSSSDISRLESKGYDVMAVSEAIREVAIAYDNVHKTASSFTFWSEDNREKATLTDLLRLLKSGLVCEQFEFNQKMFSLKQEIPTAIPVNASAPQFN